MPKELQDRAADLHLQGLVAHAKAYCQANSRKRRERRLSGHTALVVWPHIIYNHPSCVNVAIVVAIMVRLVGCGGRGSDLATSISDDAVYARGAILVIIYQKSSLARRRHARDERRLALDSLSWFRITAATDSVFVVAVVDVPICWKSLSAQVRRRKKQRVTWLHYHCSMRSPYQRLQHHSQHGSQCCPRAGPYTWYCTCLG